MLKPRHTDDAAVEAGIDEAGRGCLWGPLVAAAVVWPREAEWTEEMRAVAGQIRDSKKIAPKKRATLEAAIQKYATRWALGRVDATEIDTIGMTRANRLAFQRALDGLGELPGRVLIDGILGLPAVEDMEQVVEPQGDGTYLAVAAASILAKEGRDRMVREMCALEPELDTRYGLLASKGYGTAKHRDGVKAHGMHVQHRRLFLRKLLGIDHVIEGGYDFVDD